MEDKHQKEGNEGEGNDKNVSGTQNLNLFMPDSSDSSIEDLGDLPGMSGNKKKKVSFQLNKTVSIFGDTRKHVPTGMSSEDAVPVGFSSSGDESVAEVFGSRQFPPPPSVPSPVPSPTPESQVLISSTDTDEELSEKEKPKVN